MLRYRRDVGAKLFQPLDLLNPLIPIVRTTGPRPRPRRVTKKGVNSNTVEQTERVRAISPEL